MKKKFKLFINNNYPFFILFGVFLVIGGGVFTVHYMISKMQDKNIEELRINQLKTYEAIVSHFDTKLSNCEKDLIELSDEIENFRYIENDPLSLNEDLIIARNDLFITSTLRLPSCDVTDEDLFFANSLEIKSDLDLITQDTSNVRVICGLMTKADKGNLKYYKVNCYDSIDSLYFWIDKLRKDLHYQY